MAMRPAGVGSVENGSEQTNMGCSGNIGSLTIPNAIEMESLTNDSDYDTSNRLTGDDNDESCALRADFQEDSND